MRAYYNFIEDEHIFFYFLFDMIDIIQINFPLKMNKCLIIKFDVEYSGLFSLFCLRFLYQFVRKIENLRLSFFEVFSSNLNILKVMGPFSLKMVMHYQETLFKVISKYFTIRNSGF